MYSCFAIIGFSQNALNPDLISTQKGSLYFYWGYNRSAYTKSNINFYGSNYNFTIHEAVAKDRPSRELATYFNIQTLTIPQFNIRLGYYFKPKFDVSLGYDHMKYVLQGNQTLKMTGAIPQSENQYLHGVFNGEMVPIAPQALHYENTNGLNYVSVQITRTDKLCAIKSQKIAVQYRLGIGVGPVITQTDFVWNNESFHSEFQFTGYGFSAHAGARVEFFQRFFLQAITSSGFIHLPKVNTIQKEEHFAKQKFVYTDFQFVGGAFFNLKFKGKTAKKPQ